MRVFTTKGELLRAKIDELTLRVIATACKSGSLVAGYIAVVKHGKPTVLNIHEIDFRRTFDESQRHSLLSIKKGDKT